MNHSAFFTFLLVFLSLCSGCAYSQAGSSTPSSSTVIKASPLVELSREFNRLRNIRGHFQGGAWNDEVDSWMGLKHRVMLDLSAHIDRDQISILELKQLMGEPDRIIIPGHPAFDSLNQWILSETPAASLPDQYFIYEWRGTHDYLIFACRKEIIAFSKWRYMWE